MTTDKEPSIPIREVWEIQTVEDLLRAAVISLDDQLKELQAAQEAVKKLPPSPRYNRQKAEIALEAVRGAQESADLYAHFIVEIASEYGVPQRTIAEHMEISPPTVLKWIRNPLMYTKEEYSECMEASYEAAKAAAESLQDPRP